MVIDGTHIAEEVLAELKNKINSQLGLAAIVIGNDSALKKFVELKNKATQKVGIMFTSYVLAEDVTVQEIKDLLARLSEDALTHGIFIELPMPARFDAQELLDSVDPRKDVDVLSTTQENLFYSGKGQLLPPAVLALKIVLEKQNITLAGKKAAVFGQGRLVGKPISYWLESQGVEVTRIDENTNNPETYSRQADVIITGVGKPDLVTADMIKAGAVVIDFGYSRKDGKMVGDVAFNEVCEKASLITPVPGGMGPIVIASVLKNLVQLIQNSVI